MSTENQKIGLTVAAENEASPTFQQIGNDAEKMAAKVSQAGQKAADGVGAIGGEAEVAAQKLDRAESRIAAAMRKATEDTRAAAQAARGLADAFELKVDMRGMDPSRMQPYIKALRDAELELAKFKAQEAALATQNVFEEKHRQAKQLAKSAEYLSFWNQELDRMEAAERKAAGQNAFVNSLREQSNAIGKTRADLLELQAAQLGVSDQAAPYIAKLRQTETAMDGMGKSSKQTAWAMSMLPAQINDVIVSLQGGQAPMTVFLQQGTQIRDMFGGWGAAAKSVGGYIAGMVSPLTLAAGALAVLGLAYYQGSQEVDNYRKALVLSGNQAGTSIDQLSAMARAMSAVSGTQSAAAAGLAEMAKSSKVGSDNLQEFTAAAIQWEKATGQAVSETAKQFADLAKDPLAATLALNERMNLLTASVYDQIKALEDQGKKDEAAAVAQRAYSQAMASRSSEIVQNLGYVERAYKAAGSVASWAWDKIAGIGRPTTPMDDVAKNVDRIQQALSIKLANGPLNGQTSDAFRKGVAQLQKELDNAKGFLSSVSSVDAMTAGMLSKQKDYVDSVGELDKVAGQFASKESKRKQELAVAENAYAKAVKATQAVYANSPELEAKLAEQKAKYERSISGINDKFKEKGGGSKGMSRTESEIASIKALIANEEELIRRYQEHGVAAQDMSAAEKLIARLQSQRNEATNASVKAEKDRALVEAQRLLGLEKERISLESAAEAKKKQDAANEKQLEQIYKTVAALDDEADRIDASAATYGKARAEIERMTLAKLESRKADMQGLASPEAMDALNAQIEKQKRLITSLDNLDFTKLDAKYDKALEGAREELAIQQEGLSLLGMDEVERKKIVELRKIELKLRKELAEIDRLYEGRTDTKAVEEAEKLKRDIREKAEVDTQIAIGKIQKEYNNQNAQKYNDIFRQGFADFVNNGTEGLKAFGKSLKTTVLTSVADALYKAFAQKFVMNVVANISGGGWIDSLLGLVGMAGGSGGGGNNWLGMASNANTAYNAYTGQGWAGQAWNYGKGALGYGGTAPWTAAGVQTSGAVTTPVSGSLGAAAPGTTSGYAAVGWAAAAVIAAAYLGGMFKEEKQVGEGLTGDLGGDMYGYQLMRESGGLFDGPDYRYVVAEKELADAKARIAELQTGTPYAELGDKGAALREREMQQLYNQMDVLERNYRQAIDNSQGPIKVLQEAYTGMRENTAAKADSLGLDGDSIRAMKVALGVDEIHPDTGGKGLQLTGLTQEEASKKIQEALAQANEELARSVLGSWEEQTREITRVIFDSVAMPSDGDTEVYGRVGREVKEAITEQVFVMSEFVREGETAVQALDRLSGSLVGVNNVFELLGGALVDASLAGADWASTLVDAIGGMDALTAAASSYFDLFYSDEEKRARLAQQANKGMQDKGLDLRVEDSDAKAKYRDLVDKAMAAQDEAMLAWLLGFAQSFSTGVQAFTEGLDAAKQAADEAAQAAADALKAAQDLAMRNLEAAIGREKEYWNQFATDAKTALTKASSYFDLVTGSAASLRGSVADVATMQAAAGMVFIEQAVESARLGMGLSDYDKTKTAISAANSGLVMGNYATQAELDYDKKVLAGQLEELGGYAELAKSDAQKQIDRAETQIKMLDETLKFWQEYGKDQIDATLSVTDAIKQLEKLMFPEKDAATTAGTGGAGGGGATFGGGGGYIIGGGGSDSLVAGYLPDGRIKYTDGSVSQNPASEAAPDKLVNGQDPFSGYPSGGGSGKVEWDEAKGLFVPKFDVGTNWIPRDMLAMVHQGERIIPAADNRALMNALQNQGSGPGNAELIAAVNRLEQRLAAIEGHAASTAQSTGSTNRTIADVTENGNGMRVAAMS